MFLNSGASNGFQLFDSAKARSFAGLDRRSIISVIPPCFASVMVSQPN